MQFRGKILNVFKICAYTATALCTLFRNFEDIEIIKKWGTLGTYFVCKHKELWQTYYKKRIIHFYGQLSFAHNCVNSTALF